MGEDKHDTAAAIARGDLPDLDVPIDIPDPREGQIHPVVEQPDIWELLSRIRTAVDTLQREFAAVTDTMSRQAHEIESLVMARTGKPVPAPMDARHLRAISGPATGLAARIRKLIREQGPLTHKEVREALNQARFPWTYGGVSYALSRNFVKLKEEDERSVRWGLKPEDATKQ
jgi:hypothetical protein